MSFKAQLTGFGYGGSITGEGWPDYVMLDNGGILSVEYETRTYYPVDVKALLELAEELEWRYEAAASPGELGYVNAGEMAECASRIRDALGVEDA